MLIKMNKSNFIEILAKELKTTKIETNKVINRVLKSIMQVMKNNSKLKFIGFGTFKTRYTTKRKIKTPKGLLVEIPIRKKIIFTPSSKFKEIINKFICQL